MARFLFLISFLFASVSFSQGDDCFNAYDFGSLPNPANCGNGPNNDGTGDPVNHSEQLLVLHQGIHIYIFLIVLEEIQI